LKDDGGSQIMGSCDVNGRDGSIELRVYSMAWLSLPIPSLVKLLVPVDIALSTSPKKLKVHHLIFLRLSLQGKRFKALSSISIALTTVDKKKYTTPSL
jgi:hypothetical protein